MASVPFSFECDKASGFLMDPNEHKRVGYVTAFRGLGMTVPLAKDLTISLPYSSPTPTNTSLIPIQSNVSGHTTAEVVGVIEKFEWNGGAGDPLNIDFYTSQENAVQIKALQQTALKTITIDQLGWWITDYDQETKQWYEQSFPQSSNMVSGQLSGHDNPALNVDLTGTPAKDGIDVNVYKVSIQVAPAANQKYALSFANSSNKPVVKQWGLVVGTLSQGAMS